MTISKNLMERKFYSMDEAWEQAIMYALEDSSLKDIDIELLRSFGKILGKSDIEDQKKYFKLIYTQLEQHEKMAEDEKKSNEKMYRSMGFLLGATILIILI